jgi:hypothetical protein
MSHIHKYQRIKLGKFVVFKCTIGGCPHYIRKELIVGRQTICWRCGQPFFIDKSAARLKSPHCDCENRERDVEIDHSLDFLKQLGI